ncbi:MAG: aspartate ammonia-lyase [Kiritimatiellae bacterium]|jgi:aspartate ammonia-lyase|nr:aspartate ammonia-lyase [Kiritimatiellia bacterium]
MKTRTEHDSLGEMQVPEKALYGIHTQRAVENFSLSGYPVRQELIKAIAEVKKACALTHKQLENIPSEKADAMIAACDEIIAGKHSDAFITDALQGGAGTSTNMNVNEVIANIASIKLGGKPGALSLVSPLDDVNHGQSTNDVYPTALRIAAIYLVRTLADALAKLQESLQRKEQEFAGVLKLGRTQMMDAAPVSLGSTFGCWAQAIARDRWRIYKVEERLRQINLGGTAIGTGAAADRKYTYRVAEVLREITGLGLARAEYPMDLTQNNDVFVETSGLLKACAVNLLKISGDLRLLNSGPNGGFGEITLEARQVGSSIMPGKVNPVIPEAIAQCAMKTIANDSAITLAASNGQLELNAFLPLIADSLLDSLTILKNAVNTLRTKCIDSVVANPERCLQNLNASTAPALALVPHIGYEAAAKIAKEALDKNLSVFEVAKAQDVLPEDRLQEILQHASTYQ